MERQIERLVNLQVLDRRLRERTEAIRLLQERVGALETELAEQRQLLEACQAERAEHDARRREIEALLADEEARMKDRRMRLNRIRNEKEAAAVRREIELGKEENQKNEDLLLEIFETLDGITAREAELKEAFDAIHQRWTEERARADAEIATLSSGLEAARAERDELAADVEPRLRQRYESIFKRHRGLAVVAVSDGSCEGCHMSVAPQLVVEIRRDQRIVDCPSCHRILFWPSERESAEG